MPGAAVCFDAAVARILVEGGVSVVLCGTGGDIVGDAARSLRDAARSIPDAGRVGVMVCNPATGPDLAAAVAMAGELFGADPVVVGSADQARRMTDRAEDIASSHGVA